MAAATAAKTTTPRGGSSRPSAPSCGRGIGRPRSPPWRRSLRRAFGGPETAAVDIPGLPIRRHCRRRWSNCRCPVRPRAAAGGAAATVVAVPARPPSMKNPSKIAAVVSAFVSQANKRQVGGRAGGTGVRQGSSRAGGGPRFHRGGGGASSAHTRCQNGGFKV